MGSAHGAYKAAKANRSFLDGSSRLLPGLLTQGPWLDPGEASWARLDCPHCTQDCRTAGLQAAFCVAIVRLHAEIGLVGGPAGGQRLVPQGIAFWNPTLCDCFLGAQPLPLKYPLQLGREAHLPVLLGLLVCFLLFFFLEFKRRWGWSPRPHTC